MNEFVQVMKSDDLASGSMKTVNIHGVRVAIANVDGDVFAIDDTCSHAKCSLGTKGELDGNVVICGCHGAQFNVTNGNVMTLPATVDVKSYEVKAEKGYIYIKL